MPGRASPPQARSVPRRGRVFALLSAAAFAVLAGSPAASADGGRPRANPEEVAAARIRPAVMYLAAQTYGQVRLPTGQILSHFGEGTATPYVATWDCTGFVVNPDGWVATAGHCVDPESAKELILKSAASDYMDQFPDSPAGRDPAAILAWLQKNARVEGASDRGPEINLTLLSGTGTKVAAKMPANVVDFRSIKKGDVALLKVEKRNLPSSELATDADVSIGTSILTVGFPLSTERVTGPSLDPTNKSGKVSKKSTMEGSSVYEIDAAVSEGMSGGPTIDLGGKVIGVNSFGPVGEPQEFNFVAPADGLATMLVGKGVKATLGAADVFYRKGLDRYYAGHYTDAIKDFDQTLAMSPDYPGVLDLKTSAVNLRQQYGDVSVFRSSNLLRYLVSGALLVLAVAGWMTFTVLRSRRQRLAEAESAAAEAQDVPEGKETGTVKPIRIVPAQPLTPSEPHYCANCGASHHHAEKFCPNCGKKISVGESA
jgi:serine protease Do